jgi:aryl-alcohol dehydrogenase-like predicted oxidoreductase
MQTRRLDRSNLVVSTVGLGCWAAGGPMPPQLPFISPRIPFPL